MHQKLVRFSIVYRVWPWDTDVAKESNVVHKCDQWDWCLRSHFQVEPIRYEGLEICPFSFSCHSVNWIIGEECSRQLPKQSMTSLATDLLLLYPWYYIAKAASPARTISFEYIHMFTDSHMLHTCLREIPKGLLFWLQGLVFPWIGVSPDVTQPDIKAGIGQDVSQRLCLRISEPVGTATEQAVLQKDSWPWTGGYGRGKEGQQGKEGERRGSRGRRGEQEGEQGKKQGNKGGVEVTEEDEGRRRCNRGRRAGGSWDEAQTTNRS